MHYCQLKVERRQTIMGTPDRTGIDEESDGVLVAAAKSGNARAFDKLAVRHAHKLHAMARRIMKNQEDAEDVVQECFLKAFLHLGEFQERSRFSTWLTRIAMNEAFMSLRRKRSAPEIVQENSEENVIPSSQVFVDQSPSPEESCSQNERAELFTEAVNRLRPKIRRTVLLSVVEDRSMQETARIEQVSVSAVKSRLLHGRRILRQTMNPALLHRASASSSASV
jgi:RNA polymerase sigma factor (sigma-70 family)